MAKKKMTIEDLSGVVKKGFKQTREEIADAKQDIADTKKDIISSTKQDIADLAAMAKREFDEIGQRLNKLEDVMENIRKLTLANHKMRIDRLETEMKEIRSLLLIK